MTAASRTIDAAQSDDSHDDVAEHPRKLRGDRVRDSRERREPPALAERRAPVLDREGRDPDDADRDRDRHDGADPREEASWQRAPRLLRLGRQVRDRLEPRVREHRERERERELVPRRVRAEVDPAERVRIEEEREPEHDQEHVRDHGNDRDDDGQPVELRPADEPDGRQREDHCHSDDDVPRRVAELLQAERREVVRDEDRRQRRHDQVVEEQHPARREARGIVERAPDEQRRTAGLRDRRSSLGVRHRNEQEDDTCREQDERGEPERVQRDDAEREVERRADLAVRHRGERDPAERTRQPFEPSRHQLLRRR